MDDPRSLSGTAVLVTGAGGFVGRHVVRALADCGARVLAVTGPPGCALESPDGAEEAIEIDVCDVEAMRRAIGGREIVVHAAGPPSVAESFEQPALYARVHVEGTATLLDAARRSDVQRIVYVSSAEVYGRPQVDFVSEDHRLEPRSPYGACKMAAEQMVATFSVAFGHDAVVLRPFSLYGRGASPHAVVSRIVQMALRHQPIVVHDLRPVRDYCFITDFASAVVRACLLGSAPEVRVFNVGTMRGASVAEVAGHVLSALGLDLPVSAVPGDRRRGNSEILRLIADNTRGRSALGWSPGVALDQGLRLMLRDP